MQDQPYGLVLMSEVGSTELPQIARAIERIHNDIIPHAVGLTQFEIDASLIVGMGGADQVTPYTERRWQEALAKLIAGDISSLEVELDARPLDWMNKTFSPLYGATVSLELSDTETRQPLAVTVYLSPEISAARERLDDAWVDLSYATAEAIRATFGVADRDYRLAGSLENVRRSMIRRGCWCTFIGGGDLQAAGGVEAVAHELSGLGIEDLSDDDHKLVSVKLSPSSEGVRDADRARVRTWLESTQVHIAGSDDVSGAAELVLDPDSGAGHSQLDSHSSLRATFKWEEQAEDGEAVGPLIVSRSGGVVWESSEWLRESDARQLAQRNGWRLWIDDGLRRA